MRREPYPYGERDLLSAVIDDLPLFAASARAAPKTQLDAALQALDELDPDALSPRQALAARYRLKALGRAGLEQYATQSGSAVPVDNQVSADRDFRSFGRLQGLADLRWSITGI